MRTRHTSSYWNTIGCEPEVSKNLNTRCFGAYFAKKFIIFNHRTSWMTVAKSISQTVACHIDKGFKLYSQTPILSGLMGTGLNGQNNRECG